jgi:hypothetical protein
MTGNDRGWGALAAVVVAAVATVAAADLGLQRLKPLHPPVRHVPEGLADLAAGDPTTVVLGSSHARSFDAIAAAVEQRTDGRERLVTVPVEMGGFTSYQWILEHKLQPLLDEVDASGQKKRPSARRLFLITTFYDMCSVDVTHGDLNLPARAWDVWDFARDYAGKGLTDYNQAYLRERFKHLFPMSVMVQDRGTGGLAGALKQLVKPEPDSAEIEWSRANMEEQNGWCHDEREVKALDAIAASAAARKLDLTVVLFPLLPDIVTGKSKATTLKW